MKVICSNWLFSFLFSFLTFFSLNCSDDPISSSLDNSLLQLDTLSIRDINIQNYTVYPNIGLNSRLYLGAKNDIEAPFTFIKMTNPSPVNYWDILNDTNVNVDSIRFMVFSEDSTLNQERLPNLYYSPDSHFNENNSTYLDFENFSFPNWLDLGTPLLTQDFDDSSNFISAKLVWSLDSIKTSLNDTLDSNLTRTFGLQFISSDSNFIELYSEEANYQTTDPKVLIYYRFETTNSDTTILDTTFRTIFSASDLSVIKLNQNLIDTNSICLSSGLGLRAKVLTSISNELLPRGSLIKSANLILPIDSVNSENNFRLILDPIKFDSSSSDPHYVYLEDPYESYGFPYRTSNSTTNHSYTVSIKEYLQNLLYDNVNSLGFKIVPDENNDPFESSWLKISENTIKPTIKIIYVKN